MFCVLSPDDFNQRSRVGSDHFRRIRQPIQSISIHAPVWGATTDGDREDRPHDISIHAPVWGATDVGVQFGLGRFISIHAPVWGATGLTTF